MSPALAAPLFRVTFRARRAGVIGTAIHVRNVQALSPGVASLKAISLAHAFGLDHIDIRQVVRVD